MSDKPLICAGCFGEIHGAMTIIGGLPYHAGTRDVAGNFGRVCKAPPSIPKPPKPIPGQLDLEGNVVA